MEVTEEIFDALWKKRGKSFGEAGDQYQEFLYQAYAESLPLGIVYAHIPSLKKKQLLDWDELEYWLQDIHVSFDLWALVSVISEDVDFQSTTPQSFYGGVDQIRQAVIDLIKRSGEKLWDRQLNMTEINHNERMVYLLFLDMDAWALGHGYDVDVLTSLGALTESNGYFEVEQ